MTDEMKCSRGAEDQPHFKPLACQRCWTQQSIVVWELCHSVSLHRAAASKELTNLSLWGTRAKCQPSRTTHACIVGIGLNISLFLSSYSTTSTHSGTNGVPMLQDDKKVRVISHPVWFRELEEVASESFSWPHSCMCVCSIVANVLGGGWEPQRMHSRATHWCDSSHLLCMAPIINIWFSPSKCLNLLECAQQQ